MIFVLVLRMQLLDPEGNSDLVYALHALLQLVPQSEAYNMLHSRLTTAPKYNVDPK